MVKAITNIPEVQTDLKSCRDRPWGRILHAKVAEGGYDSCKYFATTLIRMYGKCGNMVDARLMFDVIQTRDSVPWSALILGYAENGEEKLAMDIFSRMEVRGFVPDSFTYVAALKACASLAMKGDEVHCLETGRQLHSQIRCHLDYYVENALINMYCKCGSMLEARGIFDGMKKRDVISWNTMVLGYSDNGEGHVALELYSRMKSGECSPDSLTYLVALNACISLSDTSQCLEEGKKIHMEIGSPKSRYIQSTLIKLYARCGCMLEARGVFDSICSPDVISWTALILGYAENGEGNVALELFARFKELGHQPNALTYVASIKACTSLAVNGDERECLKKGKEIHLEIGCHLDHYLQNTLISMYGKCGSMVDARRVFDKMSSPDVVSWNAVLLGYVENGEGHIALDLFSCMKASRTCMPDSITYIAALKACTSLALNGEEKHGLNIGRKLHSEIGCHLNLYVENTLIDMYSKSGSMVDARSVFESLDRPNIVSWNALLLGYVENDEGHVALELFRKLEQLDNYPDCITYIAALKACSLIGALAMGRKIHSQISQFSSELITCLVDFYAKCGSMAEAHEVFDLHLKARSPKTWTALLQGYARFGDVVSVLKLFDAMQDEGIRPDVVTFMCLLLCCSHAGLVENSKQYLEAMPGQYQVTPNVMHYNCIVDILGRARQLNEAIRMIQHMPCKSDAVTWVTLLGACYKWRNLEIGSKAFQVVMDMDRNMSSAYVLMGIIYGSKHMWEEQKRLFLLLKHRSHITDPAHSV